MSVLYKCVNRTCLCVDELRLVQITGVYVLIFHDGKGKQNARFQTHGRGANLFLHQGPLGLAMPRWRACEGTSPAAEESVASRAQQRAMESVGGDGDVHWASRAEAARGLSVTLAQPGQTVEAGGALQGRAALAGGGLRQVAGCCPGRRRSLLGDIYNGSSAGRQYPGP